MAFNPDTATQAWLATLPAADHARAIAYTHGKEWLLLWDTLVTIASALIIARVGVLQRIAVWANRSRPRPNRAAFLCTLAFMGLLWLISLPWSVYAYWWREKSYGLTRQPLGQWLGENLLASTISSLLVALLAIGLYALIRRLPRRWWAWSGLLSAAAILVMVVLAPVFIEPLFNSYKPAPPGPTREAIVALAERSGVPSDKIFIYDGSRQSERYTANVSGLFGTARVAMSDTMFKQGADLAEVRGVVGHEMGHYAEHHAVWLAVGLGVLAMILFWLVARLYPTIARRAGIQPAIADPATLPATWVAVSLAALVLTPFANSISRYDENSADVFSLEHAHEPDGLSKALVKTIAYRAASPSRIEEIMFYDHPSISRRIHTAMVWKAEHPDLIGK